MKEEIFGESGGVRIVPFGIRKRSGVRVKQELRIYSGPDATGELVWSGHREMDMTLQQFAQMVQEAGMALAVTMTDTAGTAVAVAAGSAGTAPQIAFGSGTTAAAWSDHVIEVLATGTNPVSAVINAVSAGSTSGTFTVTATWSNASGGNITISELAMYITIAANTYAYTHDVFTGQVVSNGGSAAATLTFTFS